MKDSVPNRLISETSPYLLQHAYNPVDWYPWGDEAFETAKRENKPILLSIGYSTCHWCHVMAHESFEDEEVAALLNEHFVCIKVDREERPDIDKVYMKVAQMMTGMGGWPLTIFMTPEKVPFFAATYIPKNPSRGRHGMLTLLPLLVEVWDTQKEQIAETVSAVQKAVQKDSLGPSGTISDSILADAFEQYTSAFDTVYGGFGTSPKFPAPHNIMLLLRLWYASGEDKALAMVETTLKAMRMGGIFDQIGFGFHRYSTDAKWKLPHFEKMLYDQALHIMAYTEAYQATGKDEYAQVVREIIQYVRDSLANPEGGFYSAEDADSEGEEGRFYVWSLEDIESALTPEEAKVIVALFNVKTEGNFEEEATGKRMGLNVLYSDKVLSAIAWSLEFEENQVRELLAVARRKLLARRSQRVRPLRDEKILADWNGLMVAALAKAGIIDNQFIELAEQTMYFIKTRLLQNKRLFHGITGTKLLSPSYLDDYAFVIWGLIELYQATYNPSYLKDALSLQTQMLNLFLDKSSNALYFTSHDSEALLGRDINAYDGAIPSGNSVAAFNSARLARMIGDSALETVAEKILSTFSVSIERNPTAYSMMLIAYQFLSSATQEVVLTGPTKETKKMAQEIRSWFLPTMTILMRASKAQVDALDELAPFTQDYTIGDRAMAYICINKACSLPTGDLTEIRTQLQR